MYPLLVKIDSGNQDDRELGKTIHRKITHQAELKNKEGIEHGRVGQPVTFQWRNRKG